MACLLTLICRPFANILHGADAAGSKLKVANKGAQKSGGGGKSAAKKSGSKSAGARKSGAKNGAAKSGAPKSGAKSKKR